MPYLFGADTYAAREEVQRIAKTQHAEITWLDADSFKERSASDALASQGGLFGATVSVVRDPSSLPKGVQEDIIAALRAGTQAVLWDRTAPDKRSKLWQAVKAEAREFSTLSAQQLVAWLINQAAEQTGAIEEAAARELVQRVGEDRWRLLNELNRLLLLVDENPSDPAAAGPPPLVRGGTTGPSITIKLVRQHVAEQATADIFPTLDALVRGNQAQAVRNVETLLAEGQSEFYLLSMLAYQFRILLLIAAGKAAGRTDQAIVRQGKLHPFVVQKNATIAQRFSIGQLRDALTKIMATDVAIKQGKVDARTGVLMLLVSLATAKNPA